MLARTGTRVHRAIRRGLEEYPGYALVLCGHSLGGGVASLLALLWGEKVEEVGGDGYGYSPWLKWFVVILGFIRLIRLLLLGSRYDLFTVTRLRIHVLLR